MKDLCSFYENLKSLKLRYEKEDNDKKNLIISTYCLIQSFINMNGFNQSFIFDFSKVFSDIIDSSYFSRKNYLNSCFIEAKNSLDLFVFEFDNFVTCC